jgi:hypothetical protein
MRPILWNVCATLVGDYDPVSPRDGERILAAARITLFRSKWLRLDELVALAPKRRRPRGTKDAARR